MGVFVVTGALVALVLQVYTSEKRPLRPVVVATGDWEPFIGRDLPGQGPLAELVEVTLIRAGYDPVFRFGPWQAGLDDAAAGEVLATFPFIETPERRQRFLLSEPLISFRYVLFYKRPAHRDDGADLGRIQNLEDLARHRVGLAEGYQLWGELADTVEVAERYDDVHQAFTALDDGEIDLLAEARLAGESFLHRPDVALDPSHFTTLESEGWQPGGRQELRLLTQRSPRGQAFLTRFDAALERVKGSSLYEELAEDLAGAVPRRADRITLTSAPVAAREPGGEGSRDRWYLLPRGTRAVVLEWPDAFHRSGAEPPATSGTEHWCRIKVLNGPQRGRILRVEASQVELVPPEGAP